MTDSFTIKIGDETLEVKELGEENYSDAFEIWKGGAFQFVIVPAIMNSLNPGWRVDNAELSNLSQDYINAIGDQIESHFE